MKSIYVDVSRLDRIQHRIYGQELKSNFVVSGCAGSGKTSLALLRMQRILSEIDESTRMESPMYYISVVRNFIECIRLELANLQKGGKPHPPIYNDYMISLFNWQTKLITPKQVEKFKIKAPPSQVVTLEDDRNVGGITIKKGGGIKVNGHPKHLLVDECQDLENRDILDLISSGAHIVFYGDECQSIMDFGERRMSLLKLKDIQQRVKESHGTCEIFSLQYNYRLSKSIARFAQEIYGSNLEEHCKQDSGEKPILVRVDDQADAVAYMADRINNRTDVGIGLFTNEEVRDVYGAISRKSSSPNEISCRYQLKGEKGDDYRYVVESSKVKICDFENIKGRQFDTVFIYLNKEKMDDSEIRKLYVGVTRAENRLYILYSGMMPAVLRNIPCGLYTSTDDLSDGIDW